MATSTQADDDVTRHAVWPANTHGGTPVHAKGSWTGRTGTRRVEIKRGASYRPPEGWSIDSVHNATYGSTVVRISRDD
jgi:hypothetical protein